MDATASFHKPRGLGVIEFENDQKEERDMYVKYEHLLRASRELRKKSLGA